MTKGLDDLIVDKDSYDKESQAFIDSLIKARGSLEAIASMKSSEGWKIIDSKIREELHTRIDDLVKNDVKVQTLIALLQVADTKTMSQILSREIDALLPE